MFALPFSGEKYAKLFRQALLEVIQGSRLLAPNASTRDLSGFHAVVDIVLRVVHLYPTWTCWASH